jgi:hypothetical protein
MQIDNHKTKEGGYAILFTVVIVGIISIITFGLSNTAYKQTILSSVARDSTTAFYQADIGSECAMYVDNKFRDNGMNSTEPDWMCGGSVVVFNEPTTEAITDGNKYTYSLIMPDETSISKCFRIEIIKSETSALISTEINSRGYNICNKGNMRTVERALRVTY